MMEPRDETIRKLECNSEEAVEDELKRLEELSMNLELDKQHWDSQNDDEDQLAKLHEHDSAGS